MTKADFIRELRRLGQEHRNKALAYGIVGKTQFVYGEDARADAYEHAARLAWELPDDDTR